MTGRDDLRLPSDFVEEMWTDELALEDSTWELAKEIAETVEFHEDCPNGKPSSIAAASLYIATVVDNDKRSQPVISEATGVGVTAIRNNHPQVAKAIDDTDVVGPSLENFYESDEPDQTTGSLLGRLLP